MKEFRIVFSIYGTSRTATIEAKTEDQAKQKLTNAILSEVDIVWISEKKEVSLEELV